MNNFLPYCGLTNARMRASKKDFPARQWKAGRNFWGLSRKHELWLHSLSHKTTSIIKSTLLWISHTLSMYDSPPWCMRVWIWWALLILNQNQDYNLLEYILWGCSSLQKVCFEMIILIVKLLEDCEFLSKILGLLRNHELWLMNAPFVS